MNHKKIIQSRYNETAEGYDRRYIEIQNYKYQKILDQISIQKGQEILDVGCGTGNLFLFLDKIECIKYGMDFSVECLKRYQKKKPKRKEVSILCADAENIPFKEACFDVIFLITIFQNLPDPKRCLQEIKQVCKREGLIILSFLKRKFSLDRIKQLLEEVQFEPQVIVDDENCEDIIILIQNNKKN